MNDKLTELIKTVFDKLDSLNEKEFKENLSKYYEDPLTELLSQSNKFKDNSFEYPYVPFLSDDADIYETTIFDNQVVSTSGSIIQTNVPFIAIGSCNFQYSFGYTTSLIQTDLVQSISKDDLIFTSFGVAGNYDAIEEKDIWPMAA